METHDFNTILEAFTAVGVDIRTAEFSITQYSLNTDLSFRFNNANELISFLDTHGAASEEAKENINALLIQEDIDPEHYFYVNFYKPKVAEL